MPEQTRNRQWLIADRPIARPLKDSDFRYNEAPLPELHDGEILVRSHYFGFDPAQKGWIENAAPYMPPTAIGQVMPGTVAGEVVLSKSPQFAPGDLVNGLWGWQDYAAIKAAGDPIPLEKLPRDRPLSTSLSALGLTALTAYFGLLDIGKPVAGDTVVVSGAAGATGSIVGQIAKIAGCRVIGIAGGPDKCRWLTSELGFDASIDYKSEAVGARLSAHCPDGVNVFFDNVGGEILDAVLARITMNARVVLCGGISRYQGDRAVPGPSNYMNVVLMRSRMEGFIVLDYAPRFAEAKRRLWQWVEDGRLRYKEDVQEGFENAPRTLMRLFEGKNFGKQLLKIVN